MKERSIILGVSLLIIIGSGCANAPGEVESDSKPISHDIWNGLLEKYVDEWGAVNYKGVIADSSIFNEYIALLESNHPNDKNWTRDEQKAYWINAYNAFTVQLIIRNYPVETIKELGGAIYKVNTPWAKKFIDIEGQEYSLDNIEHGTLRKKWEDGRIHFTVVCASYSCPRLRAEAYISEKLDQQMDDQARFFVNNKYKNHLDPENPKLSKLFSWYKGDFTKESSLIEFINKYAEVKIDEEAKIDHLDYRWTLNEKPYQ